MLESSPLASFFTGNEEWQLHSISQLSDETDLCWEIMNRTQAVQGTMPARACAPHQLVLRSRPSVEVLYWAVLLCSQDSGGTSLPAVPPTSHFASWAESRAFHLFVWIYLQNTMEHSISRLYVPALWRVRTFQNHWTHSMMLYLNITSSGETSWQPSNTWAYKQEKDWFLI